MPDAQLHGAAWALRLAVRPLPGHKRDIEHFLAGPVSAEVADDVLIGADLAQGFYETDETLAIVTAQVEW